MAARNKVREANRRLFGEKVQLISMNGGKLCPSCDLRMVRRMVMKYKDTYYCSERCVISDNQEAHEQFTGKA